METKRPSYYFRSKNPASDCVLILFPTCTHAAACRTHVCEYATGSDRLRVGDIQAMGGGQSRRKKVGKCTFVAVPERDPVSVCAYNEDRPKGCTTDQSRGVHDRFGA